MLDLIIKNGQCYIDGELKDVDVAIKDGKIQQIGQISEEAKETINAEGHTVLPGCIDTQTHFREPGSTDTEDLHTGSRAAIAGGIGNPYGAFLGGYLIAFAEIFLTYAYKRFFIYILPEQLEPNSLMQLLSTDYKFAISFSILVIVLVFRPSGIFEGKKI